MEDITLVINTPTLEDYIEVVSYFLYVLKIPWSGNISDILEIQWTDYRDKTCIGLNEDGEYKCIRFGDIKCYKSLDCDIMDIDWFYREFCSKSNDLLKEFK